MAYVIGSSCIDVMDRSCLQECPIDCIYEGARKLYINPVECIDCGACEPVCPEEAIAADRRIAAEQREFVEDNARFFTEALPGRSEPVGTPGSAAAVGPLGVDTPLVSGFGAP
ncbi:ferredoxin [Jiangella mangrovi]|uniref:Ferredoxin n=1 Tax=Jiangella mangrovi TaxID=1524084 RepID=A0A7W9GLK2_9ACTN|nr:ferredoxin [Jiangella mangrovi]MBB5786122.1 NAD-dependent dihydropyrimidine dehydrogenase PreA subunit [Jiangella mangrovi]